MSHHTDAEMLLITQIAYLDVPYYWAENRYSIDQIIYIKEQELKRIDASGTLTKAQQDQLNCINNIRNIAEKEHIDYHNWCIRDVRNHESESGMYACLVDTGDGDAVVGFRGSESFDGEQTWKDWVQNDFGLLNNTVTPQQKDAQDYTRYLYEKYGDDYDSFDFSGHSLGGNLAEHASLTAPEAMQSKIDRSINFDGPVSWGRFCCRFRDRITELLMPTCHRTGNCPDFFSVMPQIMLILRKTEVAGPKMGVGTMLQRLQIRCQNI